MFCQKTKTIVIWKPVVSIHLQLPPALNFISIWMTFAPVLGLSYFSLCRKFVCGLLAKDKQNSLKKFCSTSKQPNTYKKLSFFCWFKFFFIKLFLFPQYDEVAKIQFYNLEFLFFSTLKNSSKVVTWDAPGWFILMFVSRSNTFVWRSYIDFSEEKYSKNNFW